MPQDMLVQQLVVLAIVRLGRDGDNGASNMRLVALFLELGEVSKDQPAEQRGFP